MLVSLSTKALCSVRPFALGADWRLWVEWLFDAIRLPLHHSNGHGLVHKLAVLVDAAFMNGHTYIGGRPGWRRVGVPNTTHVSCFKVFLALGADCESTVWKFHIELLLEAGRRKG